jgi:hypothetical protein
MIKSAATEPLIQIRPFDVRTVGLATYITYEHGSSFTEVIEDFQECMSRVKATVTRRDRQVVRIEWPSDGDTVSLDFDEAIGYLPVRLEFRSPDMKGGFRTTELSTVEWKQVNKVWVPDHVTVSTGAKPGRVFSCDLRFEWEKVNQPVSPELFMTRGLELPDGALIARFDVKKTTQLGAVGDMTPNPKLAALEPPTPPWWWGWKGVTAVVAGVVAVAGSLVMFRRLSRRKNLSATG